MKRRNKGFSLVELIVVLTIMAIVAAVCTPSISAYVQAAKIQNYQTALNNLVDEVQTQLPQSRYWNWEEVQKNAEAILRSEAGRSVEDVSVEKGASANQKIYKITNADSDGSTVYYLTLTCDENINGTAQNVTISGSCEGYSTVKVDAADCTLTLKANYTDAESYPKTAVSHTTTEKGGWKSMGDFVRTAEEWTEIFYGAYTSYEDKSPDEWEKYNFGSMPFSVGNEELIINTTEFPANSLRYVQFNMKLTAYEASNSLDNGVFAYAHPNVAVQNGIGTGTYYGATTQTDGKNIFIYVGEDDNLTNVQYVCGLDYTAADSSERTAYIADMLEHDWVQYYLIFSDQSGKFQTGSTADAYGHTSDYYVNLFRDKYLTADGSGEKKVASIGTFVNYRVILVDSNLTDGTEYESSRGWVYITGSYNGTSGYGYSMIYPKKEDVFVYVDIGAYQSPELYYTYPKDDASVSPTPVGAYSLLDKSLVYDDSTDTYTDPETGYTVSSNGLEVTGSLVYDQLSAEGSITDDNNKVISNTGNYGGAYYNPWNNTWTLDSQTTYYRSNILSDGKGYYIPYLYEEVITDTYGFDELSEAGYEIAFDSSVYGSSNDPNVYICTSGGANKPYYYYDKSNNIYYTIIGDLCYQYYPSWNGYTVNYQTYTGDDPFLFGCFFQKTVGNTVYCYNYIDNIFYTEKNGTRYCYDVGSNTYYSTAVDSAGNTITTTYDSGTVNTSLFYDLSYTYTEIREAKVRIYNDLLTDQPFDSIYVDNATKTFKVTYSNSSPYLTIHDYYTTYLWYDFSNSGYQVGDTLSITFSNVYADMLEAAIKNTGADKGYYNGTFVFGINNVSLKQTSGFDASTGWPIPSFNDIRVQKLSDTSVKVSIDMTWDTYPYINVYFQGALDSFEVDADISYQWENNTVVTTTVSEIAYTPMVTINGNDDYANVTLDWSKCDKSVIKSYASGLSLLFSVYTTYILYDSSYNRISFTPINPFNLSYVSNTVIDGGVLHFYCDGISANEIQVDIEMSQALQDALSPEITTPITTTAVTAVSTTDTAITDTAAATTATTTTTTADTTTTTTATTVSTTTTTTTDTTTATTETTTTDTSTETTTTTTTFTETTTSVTTFSTSTEIDTTVTETSLSAVTGTDEATTANGGISTLTDSDQIYRSDGITLDQNKLVQQIEFTYCGQAWSEATIHAVDENGNDTSIKLGFFGNYSGRELRVQDDDTFYTKYESGSLTIDIEADSSIQISEDKNYSQKFVLTLANGYKLEKLYLTGGNVLLTKLEYMVTYASATSPLPKRIKPIAALFTTTDVTTTTTTTTTTAATTTTTTTTTAATTTADPSNPTYAVGLDEESAAYCKLEHISGDGTNGSTYQFRVVPKSGYVLNSLTVTANGFPCWGGGDVWYLTIPGADCVIHVDGVSAAPEESTTAPAETTTVTTTTTAAETTTAEATTAEVETTTVKATTKAETTIVEAITTEAETTTSAESTAVTYAVGLDEESAKFCKIEYVSGDGTKGSTYRFQIVPKSGYEISDVSVTANGFACWTSTGGVWNLTIPGADCVIHVDGSVIVVTTETTITTTTTTTTTSAKASASKTTVAATTTNPDAADTPEEINAALEQLSGRNTLFGMLLDSIGVTASPVSTTQTTTTTTTTAAAALLGMEPQTKAIEDFTFDMPYDISEFIYKKEDEELLPTRIQFKLMQAAENTGYWFNCCMDGRYSVDDKEKDGTLFSFVNINSSGDAQMSKAVSIQNNADGTMIVTLTLDSETLETLTSLDAASLRFTNYWDAWNWNQISVESVTFLYDAIPAE